MGSPVRVRTARAHDAFALDSSTSKSVQLVCDFVNAEVARVRSRIINTAIACALAVVIVPFVVPFLNVGIALVLGGGVFAGAAGRLWFQLRATWRKVAIKRLVAALGRRLTYQRASSVTREQVASTELLPDLGVGFERMHQVSGGPPGAGFTLHQVSATGKVRGAFAFRGTVIKLEVPRAFAGHTIIVPDSEGATAGPGRSRARDVVMLKRPTFEQAFSTYSTDYVEARRFLTPAVTELILGAAETLSDDIRVALLKRAVYVTIPGDLLFPDIALFSAPITPRVTERLMQLTMFAERLSVAIATGTNQIEIAR